MFFNKQQLHRLSTKEDSHYFHIHKLLGLLCLSHFIYRIAEGFTYGVLTFTPVSTLVWIGIHASLHISSFQFVLPQKRNHVYNTIWPEMRLHTMIFAYRSIITMFCIYLAQHHDLPVLWLNLVKGVIVMGTIISADVVTWYYKETGKVGKGDSTMRSNPYPTWVSPQFIKFNNYFYSFSQVLATMNILTYNDIGRIFMILIPIQTAPFCMTLVKKGIIDQLGWHVYYTIALVINFGYAIRENGPRLLPIHTYWPLVIIFCLLRFKFNLNKYVLWISIIAVQIHYAITF